MNMNINAKIIQRTQHITAQRVNRQAQRAIEAKQAKINVGRNLRYGCRSHIQAKPKRESKLDIQSSQQMIVTAVESLNEGTGFLKLIPEARLVFGLLEMG
jgi:hypothetical protein